MTNPATRSTTPTARERVYELHAKGLKVRDIATICGISTQRVYQILETRTDSEPSEVAG